MPGQVCSELLCCTMKNLYTSGQEPYQLFLLSKPVSTVLPKQKKMILKILFKKGPALSRNNSAF